MAIDSFQGKHRWLSNFWPAKVTLDGIEFPTVEHAYVAAKTLDVDKRREIAMVSTPGQVKRLGRALDLRADWEDVKIEVMGDLLWQKFHLAELREKLMNTGEIELIEGNNWGDTFWGVSHGVGENHLGKLLMMVRALLHEQD